MKAPNVTTTGRTRAVASTRGRGGTSLGAAPASARPAAPLPNLGLVCITAGEDVRYRTVTRTRFLALSEAEREAKLDDLYRANLQTLFKAIDYCHANGIRLYRCTSGLFPQIDHAAGKKVLSRLAGAMSGFAAHAERKGVRVVLHPDQYVVLNSESEAVRRNSLQIMEDHARLWDMLGLPRSPWACMILHGGKGGRADALVEIISTLPEGIRNRLVLENDECTYDAAAILDVCRRAGVPMVFDAHHHAVREKLDTYEHPGVGAFTAAARETWPDPAWQVVHISNGAEAFADPRHSDLVASFPSAFRDVPWVEVEAKKKELAIDRLKRQLARGNKRSR